MGVCVCACVRACVRACMHACVHACVHACMCVCVRYHIPSAVLSLPVCCVEVVTASIENKIKRNRKLLN